MPPQHTWESVVVWGVCSHERKCPQKMKKITTRRAQTMLLYQLPGSFCKFSGNTKQPTKADVFRWTREQLAKPRAHVTHHFQPSCRCIQSMPFLNRAKYITQCALWDCFKIGVTHMLVSLASHAPTVVHHCWWQRQRQRHCNSGSIWRCISKQECTIIFLQLRMGWENSDWCLEMQLVAGASLSLQRAEEEVRGTLVLALSKLPSF